MTPMACQHCHRPLNTIGDPAAPAYIHPLHVGDPGHRPVPVPADRLDTLDRRCDFCGDPHPVWALDAGPVTTILVGQAGGLMHDFGDQWAACTSCEMLAATGDINQLVDRAAAALDLRRDPAGRHRIAQLHAAFIHTRNPGRTLITTTGWPPTGHTARDLPRIRDRLTNLYRGGDRLPAQLDHPPLRAAIADGLDRAKLYWIDPEFTDLAGHAAAQLPDTVAGPDDPPAADGLIAWARPVWGGTVAAATWTTKPGRQLVIVAYRSIGGGLAGTPLQRLREQVGWLAPPPPAHHQPPAGPARRRASRRPGRDLAADRPAGHRNHPHRARPGTAPGVRPAAPACARGAHRPPQTPPHPRYGRRCCWPCGRAGWARATAGTRMGRRALETPALRTRPRPTAAHLHRPLPAGPRRPTDPGQHHRPGPRHHPHPTVQEGEASPCPLT
jgi:hypothetical protein